MAMAKGKAKAKTGTRKAPAKKAPRKKTAATSKKASASAAAEKRARDALAKLQATVESEKKALADARAQLKKARSDADARAKKSATKAVERVNKRLDGSRSKLDAMRQRVKEVVAEAQLAGHRVAAEERILAKKAELAAKAEVDKARALARHARQWSKKSAPRLTLKSFQPWRKKCSQSCARQRKKPKQRPSRYLAGRVAGRNPLPQALIRRCLAPVNERQKRRQPNPQRRSRQLRSR